MGDERPCGPLLGYEAPGEGILLAPAPVFWREGWLRRQSGRGRVLLRCHPY